MCWFCFHLRRVQRPVRQQLTLLLSVQCEKQKQMRKKNEGEKRSNRFKENRVIKRNTFHRRPKDFPFSLFFSETLSSFASGVFSLILYVKSLVRVFFSFLGCLALSSLQFVNINALEGRESLAFFFFVRSRSKVPRPSHIVSPNKDFFQRRQMSHHRFISTCSFLKKACVCVCVLCCLLADIGGA